MTKPCVLQSDTICIDLLDDLATFGTRPTDKNITIEQTEGQNIITISRLTDEDVCI